MLTKILIRATYSKLLLVILIQLALLLSITNCGGGGGGGANEESAATIVASSTQGKLAQGYVDGAQVWYDLVEESGFVNFQRDPGEVDTLSAFDGSYSLGELEGTGLLVTQGGTFLNSKGQKIAAAPMLAPMPEASQLFTNITPITTLVAAEPNLKEKLQSLGNWNTDIADPAGTSAPLLRLAKTVEGLSGLLGKGTEPIVLNEEAQLRSILVLARSLNDLPVEKLVEESSLQQAANESLDIILEDTTLVRNINSSVRTKIKESMAQLVSAISSSIPASGEVVESSIVADIEDVQEAMQAEILNALDQQVTISLGGFGLNFDPIITKITLELVEDDLILSAEVSDERPESLLYRWDTSPVLELKDPFSATTSLSDFDNSSVIVILRITDDAETYATEICAWDNMTNPTVCDFLNN